MGKEVQNLKEIKIAPNGKGGIELFVNGEKADLKDTIDIHLDISPSEGGSVVFELSARKRICFLADYNHVLMD